MNDSFEIQLTGLRHKFCLRAMAQSMDLEGIVSQLEDGAPASGLRPEIQRIAHSLAGAGGTFGFARLSAQAGDLDEFTRGLSAPVDLAAACRSLISEIKRTALQRSYSHGGS